MSNAADVGLRAKQLDELVATAQFQYFFDRMLDFVTDFGSSSDRNEALLRCGSFSEVAKQFRQQTITESEFKTQRNKYVLEALNHKDEIYEAVILRSPPAAPSTPPPLVPPQIPGSPAPGGAT